MSEVAVCPGDVATIGYMADETAVPALELYERVKQEIALRGWTWTRLCQETGLARSTFNLWKTQRQPPQPRPVNAVADALGINREEALRLAGILTEGIPEDAPFCTFEESILREGTISLETKAQLIRVHRTAGHVTCRPLASEAPREAVARL